MVPSRQLEIPFYGGIGQQHGRSFGALAQVIERTTIAFLRNYIVPSAKCAGADLLCQRLHMFSKVEKILKQLQRVWEDKLCEKK